LTPPTDDARLVTRDLRQASATGRHSTGLPADLVRQSAFRLQALALLYAFTFLMAGYVPVFFSADRDRFFRSAMLWGPGVVSITVALALAAVIRFRSLSAATVAVVAHAFQVVSSYGIAAAEFLDQRGLDQDNTWIGLSWVAPWILLFNVVVPCKPRYAVTSALASGSAVPVMVAIAVRQNYIGFQPSPVLFFFAFVFPYLLVVIMAYVGARVVYGLGTEVTRAREMGSYRLVERLGEGGMGQVWRAEHRLLVRPAAIKLIRPSVDASGRQVVSEHARRRFEREAQVIARLRSPHTVNLFDFGITSDGAFYYVMELLEGLDVQALVKRAGPVPAARAIHILRQMCHSLSEAESHGLVHRDIKPANVFLCRYGEDCDFVKILDFGIVKPTVDAAMDEPTLTRELAIHGTPAFIAPEQAEGAAHLDGRADIYATGCVAYWLLTGQLVFNADTSMGLLLHHARTPPAAPSSRTELPIPPALDDLVMACLAKSPADRPQTARELARELAAIDGADAWTEAHAKAWWSSHAPARNPG
jgi:tRNA A-37 threonylcarbamoyl transferase component Bud32